MRSNIFIMQRYKTKITGFNFLFICLLGLLTNVSNVYATSIVIVKDHQPKASIVLPDSASVQIRNAAKILQDYIKQSTGALLPVTKNVQSNNISIHIGLTDFVKKKRINLKNIDEDGFILQQVDGQNFIIVGGSDWGTEFGIYSFLERYVGVVWLMPTDMGVDIPEHATLTLPDVKVIDSPKYLSRQMSPINIESKDVLGIWGRFNRLRGRVVFHHNLLNLLDPTQYGKTNPDFYLNADTSKHGQWQPNFSARGISDSASTKIVRYFNQNPKIKSYSLGINDSRNFDESSASMQRRSGKKNYLGLEDVSDDYFRWANTVAEKVTKVFPDKLFGLLAYNNVAEPPSEKIGVNSHIVPFLTYERMRWADAAIEQQGHQLNSDWEKRSKNIGWYDYTYGLSYLVPRVWFHEMQDYLIWGTKHHVKHYYAELYPNWGEGPKPWVQSKLLWNPGQNVDSLLNIWYVRTAGEKAAPSLKEFYAIWESFWTKDIYSSKWNTDKGQYLDFNNLTYLDAISQKYILRSDSLINSAFQLSGTDLQKQRVGKLLEMWKIYKMAIELYQQSNTSNKKTILSTSPEFAELLNSLQRDPLHSLSIQRIKLTLQLH